MFFFNIQGIRAFAATSVVVFHLPLNGKIGSYAIDIFFIISGFLMSYIGQNQPRNFLIKRIARVLPLYWTATIGVFLIALWKPMYLQSTTGDFSNLLKSLFFIPYMKESGLIQPVLFLGWTINYEMYFYAMFSLSLKITKRYFHILTASLVGIPFLVNLLFNFDNIVIRFYSDPITLEFIFGIIAYYIWFWYKTRFKDFPAIVSFLKGTLIICALVLPIFEYAFDSKKFSRVLILGIPSFFLILSCVCLEEKRIFPECMIKVGNVSYSLFIIHPYIIQGLDRFLFKINELSIITFVWYFLMIIISIFTSFKVFSNFEKPCNEYFKNIISVRLGSE